MFMRDNGTRRKCDTCTAKRKSLLVLFLLKSDNYTTALEPTKISNSAIGVCVSNKDLSDKRPPFLPLCDRQDRVSSVTRLLISQMVTEIVPFWDHEINWFLMKKMNLDSN